MDKTAFVSKNIDNVRCWRGFRQGDWCHSIAVRDFIVRNVSPYVGDETFLVGSSRRTKAVREKLQPHFQEEREREAFSPWRSEARGLVSATESYALSTYYATLASLKPGHRE